MQCISSLIKVKGFKVMTPMHKIISQWIFLPKWMIDTKDDVRYYLCTDGYRSALRQWTSTKLCMRLCRKTGAIVSINTLFFLCDMIQAYRVTQHKCDKLERNGNMLYPVQNCGLFSFGLKNVLSNWIIVNLESLCNMIWEKLLLWSMVPQGTSRHSTNFCCFFQGLQN